MEERAERVEGRRVEFVGMRMTELVTDAFTETSALSCG